jgi:hypothetical protein
VNRVRESPTYIPMGMEREVLLRLPRSLKAELRHLQKLIRTRLDLSLKLGPFITTCAIVGVEAELARLAGTKPGRPGDLAAIAESWRRRPLRKDFRRHYETAYRGLPGPGVAEFMRHCAAVGMTLIRDKSAASSRA